MEDTPERKAFCLNLQVLGSINLAAVAWTCIIIRMAKNSMIIEILHSRDDHGYCCSAVVNTHHHWLAPKKSDSLLFCVVSKKRAANLLVHITVRSLSRLLLLTRSGTQFPDDLDSGYVVVMSVRHQQCLPYQLSVPRPLFYGWVLVCSLLFWEASCTKFELYQTMK
jgi:hypothetical protein